jgi:hypothetical protein
LVRTSTTTDEVGAGAHPVDAVGSGAADVVRVVFVDDMVVVEPEVEEVVARVVEDVVEPLVELAGPTEPDAVPPESVDDVDAAVAGAPELEPEVVVEPAGSEAVVAAELEPAVAGGAEVAADKPAELEELEAVGAPGLPPATCLGGCTG